MMLRARWDFDTVETTLVVLGASSILGLLYLGWAVWVSS
jgi:hypothetical protein